MVRGTWIRRGRVVGENDQLTVWLRGRDFGDLSVQPNQVSSVSFSVVVDSPIIDMVKVVQTEANVVTLFWQDAAVECASQDCDCRREIVSSLIKKDKAAQTTSRLALVVDRLFKIVQSGSGKIPGAVVRLMVSKHVEDRRECLELLSKELKKPVVPSMTNVTDQCEVLCSWRYLEDIISCWILQMQVRDDLDTKFGL